MAYVAPPYNNIILGEEAEVPITPRYNNIILGAVLNGIGRYAMIMFDNHMVAISDNLLGTNIQPVVLTDEWKLSQRVLDEGIPVVIINNHLVTLPEEDHLVI